MAAKYIDTITDRAGNALAGASVQVVDQGGALVTLYSDPDLLVPIGTSARADYNGLIQFYVPDGVYTIRQVYAGTVVSIPNVELYDLTDLRNDATAATALASQMEAETGEDNAKRMSPLRTKQAIDAQTPNVRLSGFSGGIIPGNPTIKEALQSVSDAALARLLIDDVFFDGRRLFKLGDLYGNGWDGNSDQQFMVGQTQTTFLPNGSLGAIYGQRIADYTGGSTGDTTAPAVSAVRGYNQIRTTVTYGNELAGLFVTDNYSWLCQGSGLFGQGISRHGGRVWGLLGEAKEYGEDFTAEAGQTTFTMPNGFNAIGGVKKNGTFLSPADYSVSGNDVILSSAAVAGDSIRIYRANPQQAFMGQEIGCYGGAGTDNANPLSGNRVVIGAFGYRADPSEKGGPPVHIGTGVNIVADPADATLQIDRGILFQGHFGVGVDFSAVNAEFSQALMRFNASEAGCTSAQAAHCA